MFAESNALDKFVLCLCMFGRQNIRWYYVTKLVVRYSFTSIFVYHLNFRVSSYILIKPIVICFVYLLFLKSPFFIYFRVPIYLANHFFIYLRVLKYTNNDTRNTKILWIVYKALIYTIHKIFLFLQFCFICRSWILWLNSASVPANDATSNW